MEALVVLTWLLAAAASLASFVCLIIVLTKLFPQEGVGMGILGILCSLYAFIWGWQNKDRHNLQTTMVVWTIAMVLGIVIPICLSVILVPLLAESTYYY